jgi:hypothetical protein
MSARRLLIFVGLALLIVAITLFELTHDKDEKPALRSIATSDAGPTPPHADAAITIDSAITIDASIMNSFDAGIAARQERETVLASLRESGEGHEGWETQATELFGSLANRDTQVSDVGCYIAGCAATFTFSSQAAYHSQIDRLQTSPAYAAWTGGKRYSAPETREDGRVIVALVLYRPD